MLTSSSGPSARPSNRPPGPNTPDSGPPLTTEGSGGADGSAGPPPPPGPSGGSAVTEGANAPGPRARSRIVVAVPFWSDSPAPLSPLRSSFAACSMIGEAGPGSSIGARTPRSAIGGGATTALDGVDSAVSAGGTGIGAGLLLSAWFAVSGGALKAPVMAPPMASTPSANALGSATLLVAVPIELLWRIPKLG